MAVDGTQVIVPGNATLYFAALGATLTAGLATPGTAWTDAGYLTEDGATFNLNRTVQDITVWQSLDPVRKVQQSLTKDITMTLRQWNPANIKFALGGGTIAPGTGTPGGTAFGTYTYPAAQENPTVACVLDVQDGSYTTRFFYPSMVASDNISVPISRNDSMTLPISLTSLASSTVPVVYSNGPGWTS
jgi:hypothetical protein